VHNEFNNCYSSPVIIRLMNSTRMILVGDVTRMGDIRRAHKPLVGKHERKRTSFRTYARVEV
jgi:hypothetical protein